MAVTVTWRDLAGIWRGYRGDIGEVVDGGHGHLVVGACGRVEDEDGALEQRHLGGMARCGEIWRYMASCGEIWGAIELGALEV